MKWYLPVVLVLSSCTLALAQSPIHGATSSSGGSRPGDADTQQNTSGDSMQVRSIDQVLHDNPKLVEKLKALLPADITPEQACSGYKTLEQCVSAVHLAADLKISFSSLRMATTGKHAAGLEKAAAQLAPAAETHAAVKKARAEAGQDMKGITLLSF